MYQRSTGEHGRSAQIVHLCDSRPPPLKTNIVAPNTGLAVSFRCGTQSEYRFGRFVSLRNSVVETTENMPQTTENTPQTQTKQQPTKLAKSSTTIRPCQQHSPSLSLSNSEV